MKSNRSHLRNVRIIFYGFDDDNKKNLLNILKGILKNVKDTIILAHINYISELERQNVNSLINCNKDALLILVSDNFDVKQFAREIGAYGFVDDSMDNWEERLINLIEGNNITITEQKLDIGEVYTVLQEDTTPKSRIIWFKVLIVVLIVIALLGSYALYDEFSMYRNCENMRDYKIYLNKHPNGIHSDDVKDFVKKRYDEMCKNCNLLIDSTTLEDVQLLLCARDSFIEIEKVQELFPSICFNTELKEKIDNKYNSVYIALVNTGDKLVEKYNKGIFLVDDIQDIVDSCYKYAYMLYPNDTIREKMELWKK
ncbi:MAG: hypothetical protein J5709_07375 [Bacteroidales bacterium]|nr:hypothetical protein [Bacteroidales bacterium]